MRVHQLDCVGLRRPSERQQGWAVLHSATFEILHDGSLNCEEHSPTVQRIYGRARVAALTQDSCICGSFGPLNCEYAQPGCGRYAGHSHLPSAEGYRAVGLKLVILCFPVQTPPSQLGFHLTREAQRAVYRVDSALAKQPILTQVSSASRASLTGAHGPSAIATD